MNISPTENKIKNKNLPTVRLQNSAISIPQCHKTCKNMLSEEKFFFDKISIKGQELPHKENEISISEIEYPLKVISKISYISNTSVQFALKFSMSSTNSCCLLFSSHTLVLFVLFLCSSVHKQYVTNYKTVTSRENFMNNSLKFPFN